MRRADPVRCAPTPRSCVPIMHPLRPKLMLGLLGLALTACGAAQPASAGPGAPRRCCREPAGRALVSSDAAARRGYRHAADQRVQPAWLRPRAQRGDASDRRLGGRDLGQRAARERRRQRVRAGARSRSRAPGSPAVSVNTAPATQYAGHPTLAIDAAGRIHALFAQDGYRLHYSRSTDFGRTWTTPEPVATPTASGDGMALRAAVDAAGDAACGVHRRRLWLRLFLHLARPARGGCRARHAAGARPRARCPAPSICAPTS